MNKALFSDFNSVSAKAWKQKIQVDLKGADYNDTLIWKTNEGIDVKPFYHADNNEVASREIDTPKSWNIGQVIFVANAKKANEKALDAIARGAESITFIIANSSISEKALLENIIASEVKLYFKLQFLTSAYITSLLKQLGVTATGVSEEKKPVILTDIIGDLAREGNWHTTLKEDHVAFNTILKQTQQLNITASLYENAGANSVQQLAYSLAHANEYLNHIHNSPELSSLFFTSEALPLNVTFTVSIGTNYFFEIAKLRALRLLWKTLAGEYECLSACEIIATPTKRNKTIYDYNTNMLRTTTECMSAVLGGANTICNLPYDAIYHKDNEFGERIARNQLLILKKESYFDVVDNASEGSYYIKSLTQQLAEKALTLFKEIEASGGFLKHLKDGSIQKKIKESATKTQTAFNEGKLVLLGTNKHPNVNDKMKQDLEVYPFVKMKPRKTVIEPIIERRLAEINEQERLKNEN